MSRNKKTKNNVFTAILLVNILFAAAACGKQEPASISEEPGISEGFGNDESQINEEKPEDDVLEQGTYEEQQQFSVRQEDLYPHGRHITDQTFEVELRPFGQVTFAPYAPEEGLAHADAVFLIERDGGILSQLPGAYEENVSPGFFNSVDEVSVCDYNNDSFDDIIIILSYVSDDGMSDLKAEPRLYCGSGSGAFYYDKETSEEASFALANMSAASILEFIGYEGKYISSIDAVSPEIVSGFTQETIDKLAGFIPPATNGETGTFEDFDKILKADFDGLWYDPEIGESVWIKDRRAYAYIPYLGLYGDEAYSWELIDRKQQGKCPELAIYHDGKRSGPLAYYVGGITDDYFWCVGQGQVFYKVED